VNRERTAGVASFDHAVSFYDETRGLSPAVSRATTDLLAAELAGSRRLLEVGVGTGLIALPLVERGFWVDGVDLSVPMLARARTKSTSDDRFRLLAADATRLPFRQATYDGAFMRHVLHLIPMWRRALREVVRVVRPGGTVLVSTTDYTGLYRAVQERFLDEAGGLPLAVGIRPDDHGSLWAAMSSHGARRRRLPTIHGRRSLTIRRFIAHIEQGHYTWTWSADEERRLHAARRVREWLGRRYGDLDRPVEPRYEITWWAFDLPPRGRRPARP